MSERLSGQRAPPLHCQDAVHKAETEAEAVMVVLVEPGQREV